MLLRRVFKIIVPSFSIGFTVFITFSVLILNAGCGKKEKRPLLICNTNANCPEGYVCISDECIQQKTGSCKVNSECQKGYICQNGECILEKAGLCSTDSDCPPGYTCANSECTPQTHGSCETNDDCETGYVCENGECTKSPTASCTTDADCPFGQVCQNGACVSQQDTTPPETTITSYPSDPTNSTSATFEFTSTEAGSTFECQLDGGGWSSCTSPKTYAGLSEGSHTFEVGAIDSAGNVDPTPESYTWTVDTTSPNPADTSKITVNQNPLGYADTVSGSAGAVEPGAWVIIYADAGGTQEIGRTQANSDGSFGEISIGDNQYGTVYIVVEDGAGNRSSGVSVNNDISPPDTTITSYPKNPTTDTTATFTFASTEPAVTFECQLDSGEWQPCTSPTTYTGLLTGVHTLYVRAKDPAGNVDPTPDSYIWSIVAPLNWLQVSAGLYHTCAVASDGTLWCWGFNEYGQLGDGSYTDRVSPTQVVVDANWISVSSGYYHTCGVQSDGSLWCWGANWYGQLGDGTYINSDSPVHVGTESNWMAVSAGGYHTCGLKADGTLWCWGGNFFGELGDGTSGVIKGAPVPVTGENANWASVSAGLNYTCGLKSDGSLLCWGRNDNGQIGDGTYTDRLTPTQVGVGRQWVSVAAGSYHACAVMSDSTLWCWGNNWDGQVGDGTNVNANAPVPVTGQNADWAFVTAGGYHTCGAKVDGALYCWGWNNYGQLGDGTDDNRYMPTPVTGQNSNWVYVSGGYGHTCGVKADGTLLCWGHNAFGELGDGTEGNKSAPSQAGSDTNWSTLTTGWDHTCAVRTDRTLWCWGANWYGQLGDGTFSDKLTPTQVGSETDWLMVAGGWAHTCAVKTGGTLWCWGRNNYGQVGDGTNEDRSTPTAVTGQNSNWIFVTAGTSHTCGIKGDNSLWCWGLNNYGQLGDGTTVNRNMPTPVSGQNSDWLYVAGGEYHTCGLKLDGTLWCWGRNNFGQLGDGSYTDRLTPTQVGAGSSWIYVTAGFYHTCGVQSDGSLWCWGANWDGQLGDGTKVNKNMPTQVTGQTTSQLSVGAGYEHTCDVQTDQTLWCWGLNNFGQLGDGTDKNAIMPTPVTGQNTNWSYVDGGYGHTCGIKTDGTLWCWGNNEYGQLGDGTAWKNLPVVVPKP